MFYPNYVTLGFVIALCLCVTMSLVMLLFGVSVFAHGGVIVVPGAVVPLCQGRTIGMWWFDYDRIVF